jgi:hypothetical protein
VVSGFLSDRRASTDGSGTRIAFQTEHVLPGGGGNADGELEVYQTVCRTFTDTGTSNQFYGDIEWMAASGISTGYDDGTYRPSAPVSRGAMAAFMYRLADLPLGPYPNPGFSDVNNGHPFWLEISWMAHAEITGGYDDGTFRPSAPVSRGAMSAFMYRLAGEPPFADPPTGTFPDVGTSHPFFTEVEWMDDEDITNGYSDGTYRPAAPVSRQAMSAFMRRLDEGPGVDL